MKAAAVVANSRIPRLTTSRVIGRCFSSNVIRGPSLLQTSTFRPSPSLLMLPGLRSLPFWTYVDDTTRVAYQDPEVSHAVQLLEDNWRILWDEYRQAQQQLPSDYATDTEHTTLHHGGWDWHTLLSKGDWTSQSGSFPATTSLLRQLPLFEGTPFGYAFFSTLQPNSSIDPHTSPLNFRLRIHLALDVPKGDCGLQVGPRTQQWSQGHCTVLDDSYVHHVWNKTSEPRVVLLVDIWHPDVTADERKEIVGMFQEAKEKGWWNN